MAIRTQKVSDLDGSDNADYDVVVRRYPDIEGDKILNVSKEQAEALQALAVKDVMPLEVRLPDGSSLQVLVTKPQLDKWLGNTDVLKSAASLRGRRPGYSPNN